MDTEQVEDVVEPDSSEAVGMATRGQANLILLLLLGLLVVEVFSLVQPPPQPKQWEYRVEAPSDYRFSEEMNEWGEEGWELASARRATSSTGASYEVVLKRAR